MPSASSSAHSVALHPVGFSYKLLDTTSHNPPPPRRPQCAFAVLKDYTAPEKNNQVHCYEGGSNCNSGPDKVPEVHMAAPEIVVTM